MTALLNQGIRRVAIVDDSRDEMVLRAAQLMRMGIEACRIFPSGNNVENLVDQVRGCADGAICDNVLQHGSTASFYGAEAVARLYDYRIPAILITQFFDQDYDVSIRKWREKIPVVLRKEDVEPVLIETGLLACLREYQNDIPPSRQTCRTLIRVIRLEQEAGEQVVDALVLSWDAQHPVRFPAALLSPNLQQSLAIDQYFIARVNTGAESPADLFFADFELAPEPITEDNLV